MLFEARNYAIKMHFYSFLHSNNASFFRVNTPLGTRYNTFFCVMAPLKTCYNAFFVLLRFLMRILQYFTLLRLSDLYPFVY